MGKLSGTTFIFFCEMDDGPRVIRTEPIFTKQEAEDKLMELQLMYPGYFFYHRRIRPK